MKMQWIAALLAAVGMAGLNADSRAQTAADLTVTAVRLQPGEILKLDGTLSHPAWQRAPVYDRFVAKLPRAGAAPVQATKVQVLFDEQALYVGVTALDSEPALIRDTVVRHDGVIRTQDFVAVYIDAIGTRSSAQWFRINAAGSLADGLHTAADDSEDFAPDFDWDGAAARIPKGSNIPQGSNVQQGLNIPKDLNIQQGSNSQQGWTAVFRLPFASLRFAEGRQAWKIMVARRVPREQFHLITSVLIPADAASFIATLQPLAGVQLPASHQFLSLRPGITLRHTRQAGQSNNVPNNVPNSERKTDLDASLDLKWRPRAELVVDATLNPDFSQVALDVPQLAGNSRFALRLAEKRPFFFESADLLRTPTDALYTRSFTQPRGGLRATWRGMEWAGTAFAIRDRGQGRVLLPGAYGTRIAEQPASDSVSLRARSDTGGLAYGGIVSARRYEDGRGENTVLGPDVSWQISEQWRMRGQWLHARTTAQTDSRGQLTQGAAVNGDRLRLRAVRQTGDGETAIGLDDISAGFRHDSGFVNQAGIRRLDAFHSIGWRGVGPFNEVFLNVEAYQVRDRVSGVVVQEVIRPGFWSSGASNLEWRLALYAHSRLRTSAAAPLLSERYVSSGLVMTPATWWPLVDVSVDIGRLADTAAGPVIAGVPQGQVRPGGRFNFSARLRLLPALELEPRFNQAWLRREGGLTYRETAQQWLAVWHFDARHNLRAIVQRRVLDRRAEATVAAANGLSRTESLTYAWRQSAGTRLYVGATRARFGRSAPTGSTEVFIKLEFDAQDLRALIS